MAGSENETDEPRPERRLLPIVLAALIGAAVVLVVAGTLGRLIEGAADPVVLIGFAAAGAIFGVLAWGAVAHDRRHYPPVRRAG